MLDLQDVKSVFESGEFAIRQKPGKFNGVWSDMATEKTVIRDSKGRGGIVGITRQKSALIRAKNTFVPHNCWSSSIRTRRLKL
jgi:hypothetical protein